MIEQQPPYPEVSSPFVVRVERQVTWGLPEVGAAADEMRRKTVAERVRRDRLEQSAGAAVLLDQHP